MNVGTVVLRQTGVLSAGWLTSYKSSFKDCSAALDCFTGHNSPGM